jgi:hypothetical protein
MSEARGTCEMVLVDNFTEYEHKCGQPASYRLEGDHLACQRCAVGLANDGIVVFPLPLPRKP